VTFTVEVDFACDYGWSQYARFTVQPGEVLRHVFPDGYSAHWVRVTADSATMATAQFTYGPATPEILSASMQTDGGFVLTFSGNPGQPYSVRVNDEMTEMPASWPALVIGLFETHPATFLDVDAKRRACRFFSVTIS
jgi:hypothetical protein